MSDEEGGKGFVFVGGSGWVTVFEVGALQDLVMRRRFDVIGDLIFFWGVGWVTEWPQP